MSYFYPEFKIFRERRMKAESFSINVSWGRNFILKSPHDQK